MILRALETISWSSYNCENGSRIHGLTSTRVTIGRDFTLLISLLTTFIVL